jgi:membrane protease YdiL (CAAX protease family)
VSREQPSHAATAHDPKRAGLTWRVFGVLMLGSLVGCLALLPYLAVILGPSLAGVGQPLPVVLALSLIQPLVLCAVSIFAGLRLGDGLGLGAPLLRDWLAGAPGVPRRLRSLAIPAVIAGLGVGVLILAVEVGVFAPRLATGSPEAPAPSPAIWQGLLASLYGGICEEILLRLGLMTVLAWIGARLTRVRQPGPGVMWGAIVISAVLFGLGHLPATAAVAPLTPLLVVRAIVLNGLGGIVYGWLYWRRDLVAAMIGHFCTDIVLHVLAPALRVVL